MCLNRVLKMGLLQRLAPLAEENLMSKIKDLQRFMFQNYIQEVGLDSQASYIYGNPLRPVVPLDVGTGGVFFLGAYPSARFEYVKNVEVPVGDILGPFANDRWFDGKRRREQCSSKIFQDSYLGPLELDRSACLITNLVKVFLFKNGHVKKYQQLGAIPPKGYERESFFELGKMSVPTLEKELKLAQPQIMITLGNEVAGVLRGVRSNRNQSRLLVPEISDLTIGETTVKALHFPHPENLKRKHKQNPWPTQFKNEFIPMLKRALIPVDR